MSIFNRGSIIVLVIKKRGRYQREHPMEGKNMHIKR
jgi:hypothetical protein